MIPVYNPPSAEEWELLQEFGGHEPEVGDDLLAALRKEREALLQPILLEAEDQFFRQRLRAFLESTEVPR